MKRIGKQLPLHIYRLISHIEGNVFEGGDGDNGGVDAAAKKSKAKNPKADKAKVLRDTKYIPKLILRIENFNKFVNCLSKKTKHDLSKLLHKGTVQDFRIRTEQFQKIIDRTLGSSQRTQIDENDLENGQSDDDDDEDDENDDHDDDDDDESIGRRSNESEAEEGENGEQTTSKSVTSGSPTPTNDNIVEDPSDDSGTVTTENALNHLAAINKKVNKRRKRAVDADDDAEQAKPSSKRVLRKRWFEF